MAGEHTLDLTDPALAQAASHILGEIVTLAEASQEISAELSVDRLLQLIVERARNLVGCKYAALSVIDEDRTIQSFITSGIDEDQRKRIGGPPEGRGILGLVLDSREPLRIDDLGQHPDAAGFPPGHPPMKTFLGVPIRHRGRTLGNLYLTEKLEGGRFTDIDAQLVTMYAAQAGIAIENARLFTEAEKQRNEAFQQRLSLEAVLNSMAEGIYTLDNEWRITRVNAHAAGMIDEQPGDILGRKCWEVFQYQTPEGVSMCEMNCPARRAIGGQGPGYVMEATLPTGRREIPVALLADAIRGDDGRVLGVVESVRDITQRKEIDELRDSIVSLVSHELRTPLSHIKGFSSSLLQPDIEWDEETKLDFIRSIDLEADRLSRLVSDLLEMSRLESGRTVMRAEAVELPDLVNSVLERSEELLRGHTVRLDFEDGLPSLHVDWTQIERVIENLLENAAKYSPPGTDIGVSAGPSAGGELGIGVHDSGVGIPEEQRENVFRKFVRLEQDKTFRSPGTGLGLSICKYIVEAHRGSIWVEGNSDGGSVFRLTLPTARSSGTQEDSHVQGP